MMDDSLIKLTPEAALAYWRGQGPASMQAISRMEHSEEWVVDGAAYVRDALNNFGVYLSSLDDDSITTRISPHDLLLITSFIRAGMALRLLKYVNDRSPELAQHLLDECLTALERSGAAQNRSCDAARIYFERLRFLERAQVLLRVLGKENVELVLKSLRQADIERGAA